MTSFLAVPLALLDPTRYNICSKYSLILAVRSGSERCVGHLLLPGVLLRLVFLSPAHHISPTWWMYMTSGGDGAHTHGRRWLCEPRSLLSAPRRSQSGALGSEIKSLIRSLRGCLSPGLVRGAGLTVALGFLPHLYMSKGIV